MLSRSLLVALVCGLLAVLLAACDDKETPVDYHQPNTGVTNKSTESGLIQPEDMGTGWYQTASANFLKASDLPNTSACTPVKGFVSAEQAGLDAESQHMISHGADLGAPAISEELRVFKSDNLAAPILQALRTLVSSGSRFTCHVDTAKAAPRAQTDTVPQFTSGTPLTPGPDGGIAYRDDYVITGGAQPFNIIEETHVWVVGRRMITLEVTGAPSNVTKAFVEDAIAKATTAAARLDSAR